MSFFLAASEMLAGIGFFLLGMNFVEESLRKLAGRSFKIFLRHQTNNKLKAIAGGAIVTGILQSSSIVNLMVLAFVGAGVITMQNALAVILGANIGTTLSSWVVASLGFSFKIELFSLPLTGASAILMVIFNKGSKAYSWSKFLFGLGALFIGLGFMKNSFGDMASQIDFSVLIHYPIFVFVILGFAITSIIQSSSATVAITLSALNAQAISLYVAMGIVLGSEVGTTIKLLMASAYGLSAKRRVAFGNFIYNSVLLVIFLFALRPINKLLTDIIQFQDPLIALVFFQSFINVAGVIIFFPFLRLFEKILQGLFKDSPSGARYIKLVPAVEADLALDALDKEAKRFIWYTLDFQRYAVDLPRMQHPESSDRNFYGKSFSEQYDYLKLYHGEIHSYYMGMSKEGLDKQEFERVEQIISSVRNCMFSAKSMKDSHGDIEQLHNSSNLIKYDTYKKIKSEVAELSSMLASWLTRPINASMFEDMVSLYNRMQQGYTSQLKKLYHYEANQQLTEVDISTLINFNREFYASYKALVWAIKDYILEKEQATYFSELPGFIR